MPATLIGSGVHRQMRVQRYNFFAKRTNIYWKSCTFAPELKGKGICRRTRRPRQDDARGQDDAGRKPVP